VVARSEAAVQSRLELANGSFEAKNYRAALAYALEVLAIAPEHAGAAKIRDESRVMLGRFDAAIADARRYVDAGDVRATAQALEAARAIDPTAPSVSEIATRLADQVRTRAEAVVPRERAVRPPPPSPTTSPAPPRIPPSIETPPIPVRPAAPQADAPATQASVPAPQPPASEPAPAPPNPTVPSEAAPPDRTVREPVKAAPSSEDDDAALRRVVSTYGRAIETKDLALFRTVKPNLSSEEERRLAIGFRAVVSQRVELTILSIERRGQDASIRVARRDTIQAAGRPQTTSSQQTITLTRTNGGWVIVEIR
jgi:hypothetical protein